MPIHCPFDSPRLSEDEMRTVDFTVMRLAFDTHNELGRLCDESVDHLELVLMKSHEGQLLEYLCLTNSTRGKLVYGDYLSILPLQFDDFVGVLLE